MEILFVILSLLLLIFLCFKGVPIFFSAMISGIFLLLTAGMNPVEQMTTTYVNGLAGYFGNFSLFLYLVLYLESLLILVEQLMLLRRPL